MSNHCLEHVDEGLLHGCISGKILVFTFPEVFRRFEFVFLKWKHNKIRLKSRAAHGSISLSGHVFLYLGPLFYVYLPSFYVAMCPSSTQCNCSLLCTALCTALFDVYYVLTLKSYLLLYYNK
jgi:hypothetical protein